MTQRELLSVRLCDLNVSIEGTWLEERIERVRDELAQRDLRFNPHFWLSDEWFSPTGVPGVALPFYLAHPKLIRLERSQMLEAEGATAESCLRLLRHELGHAIQHAFKLSAPPRVAAPVRQGEHALSGGLPAQSREPPLRAQSPRLVRPEPPGGGFRRDLRGLAAPPLQLAPALQGLAGAAQARICRPPDERARRSAAARSQPRQALRPVPRTDDPRGLLRAQAGPLFGRLFRCLRPRSEAPVQRGRGRRATGARRRRRFCGGTAARSGAWSQSGQASTNSRSIRFSIR